MRSSRLAAGAVVLLLGACAAPGAGRFVRTGATGSTASLRGIAACSSQVAWATGSAGTVLRTVDGGATWRPVGPRGADRLDFRAVHAFDAERALIATAGAPARVYATSDGGSSWQLAHADDRAAAFFDALVFAGGLGILASDPIDGCFAFWTSRDCGASWQPLAPPGLPPPMPGEAMFAAGNGCVHLGADGTLLVVTGGAVARALVRLPGSEALAAVPLPLRQGKPSQGAFAVAFAGARHGVAVGGDYEEPQADLDTAAFTEDGGMTWQRSGTGAGGFRSAVVHWPGTDRSFIAAGSHGCSVSRDGGRTFTPVAGEGFHALAAARDGAIWAAGAGGRVARWRAASGE